MPSPLLCARPGCSLQSLPLCPVRRLLSHKSCCTHHLDLETTFSCHFERTLTPVSVLHGAAAGWHLLLRATGCCSCWIPLLQAQAAVAPNPAALPLTQGPRCHTCRPGLSWPPPTSRPASFYDASLVWVCSCPAPLQAAQLHRQIPGQGAPDAHSRHRASQRHTPRHQEGDQTHHPGGEASHMLL